MSNSIRPRCAVCRVSPLPAPDQHCDFFVTADERREMALARAASAAACPYQPEKRHRLWHTLQIMAAALLGDKKAGDLALHLRCHDDAAGFRNRLHSRRSVRCITVNLTCRIHDDRAGFYPDACVERRLARTGVLAVDVSERALD